MDAKGLFKRVIKGNSNGCKTVILKGVQESFLWVLKSNFKGCERVILTGAKG